MIVLGVDLGYGDTKVVGPDSGRAKFPSRWAATEAKNWGIGGSSTILTINDSDPFFFGDDATGAGVRDLRETEGFLILILCHYSLVLYG